MSFKKLKTRPRTKVAFLPRAQQNLGHLDPPAAGLLLGQTLRRVPRACSERVEKSDDLGRIEHHRVNDRQEYRHCDEGAEPMNRPKRPDEGKWQLN